MDAPLPDLQALLLLDADFVPTPSLATALKAPQVTSGTQWQQCNSSRSSSLGASTHLARFGETAEGLCVLASVTKRA